MPQITITERQRYLPLHEVKVGMLLARPLQLANGRMLVLSLPAGHALTETDLNQLRNNHAQYACVIETERRSELVRARQNALQVRRLEQIFRHADRDDPATRMFYDAILGYRTA
jgi:hypothetical protein